MLEAWGEIRDLDNVAKGIGHGRNEHSRILEIGLLAGLHPDLIDRENATLIGVGLPRGTIEKRREDRFAVEARKAAPDDLRPAIHQSRNHAIADDGKVERTH
jgi:hypothetical protein